MNSTPSRVRHARRLVGCVAVLLTGGLLQSGAQQTPPSAASDSAAASPDIQPSATKNEADDIVVLSPFVVEASEDEGYLATSTLAGTRLRSNLRDVGSAISVVTQQFLDDTASRNVEDLLVYTVNSEIGGVSGNFSGVSLNAGGSTDETGSFTRQNTNSRIRGISGVANTRDYFITDIPWDSYNVGRVDQQRGPNSILFGLGDPAGVINAGLNQAGYKQGGKFEVRFDQFGSIRALGDYNQVVVPKQLAVRVSALNDETQYRQEPAFNDDQRLYAALRYDPAFFAKNGFKTTFRANYENGDIEAMRPRTLPPIDRLSAWFSETPFVAAANPRTGKPVATYAPINRAVYNNWDMVSSAKRDAALGPLPSTALMDPTLNQYGFAAEAGRHWLRADPATATKATQGAASKQYTSGYFQNPYYNPWISEVYTGGTNGFLDPFGSDIPLAQYANGGPTLQYGINNSTNTGFNQTATPIGIVPNGNVGYFPYTQWQTIAEPWKTYRYLEIPFGSVWRDPSLTDRGVFDFVNKSLDGDNRRSWRNFDAFNLALDQTIWNNRAGISIVYDSQDYEDGSHSIFNDRLQTITVDLNATFPASNLPNPNAGRAMMAGDGNYNTSKRERDEIRATAFVELKATDLLQDSWLTDILGRHILTGFASENTYEKEDRGHRRFMLDPQDLVGIPRNLGYSGDATGYRTVVYLSPDSMQDRAKYPNMSSLGLQAPKVIAPGFVDLDYFDSHWRHTLVTTASGYVDPNATWVNTYSGGSARQRDNPDNYVGRKTARVRLLDATNPDDLSRMVTSLNMDRNKIESQAFVWQGFLFGGNVVPTFGYREDTATSDRFQSGSAGGVQSGVYRPNPVSVTVPGGSTSTWGANPDGVRTEDGFVMLDSPNIRYNNVAPTQSYKLINRSWSVVGHSPDFIRRHLPWGTSVSLSYNESSNFDPSQAGRVDIWGRGIMPPGGETEDWGLLVSMLENRVNFRVVRFETSQARVGAGGFNLGQFKEIETRSWVGAKKMQDAIRAAETTDWEHNPLPGVTPYTSTFNTPSYLYGTIDPGDSQRILYASQAEKDALLARGRAAANAILNNIPQELFAAWNVPLDGDAWRTVTDIGALPSGSTTTQDTKSEGWEFEMTVMPLRNWRITGNFSTSEAERDNIYADIQSTVLERNDYWTGAGPQGTFHYSNPGRETSRISDDWNTRVMTPFTSGVLANGQVVQEAVAKRANLVTTYDFQSDSLKGLSLGGGIRWEDKAAIGYMYQMYDFRYESGGVERSALVEVPDLSKPIYGDSLVNLDLWVGYSRKISEKVRWKVQLNIRNLGDSTELVPVNTQPDGTLAQYRIKEGQAWSLTNTFSF